MAYPAPPPGWATVFMTPEEDVKAMIGGISVGRRIEEGDYCISTTNVAANCEAFLMVPRHVLAELRDALNRELAS